MDSQDETREVEIDEDEVAAPGDEQEQPDEAQDENGGE